ncbi:hypothetical protein FGO68_gene14365 [Halteria grandinella]|uniref:Gamma-glutamylcyclotransferase AIG2-like domain-containing protein n=1 Tax=Halteria grandinella TaxID=5974 RepID=A0A8J8NI11_HALGN|nr:hypothetical protein FGO68_gene14365 [Halteria grandinella]
MEGSIEPKKKRINVFCYGSNHPEQLFRRLNVPILDLLSRSFSCSLPEWKRVYCGVSRNWGGNSVANVVRSSGEEAIGYAVTLKKDEIKKLDEFEGYPTWYTRTEVKLKVIGESSKAGEMVDGIVYEMIKPEMLVQYTNPSPAYLEACSKTLSTNIYLSQPHRKPYSTAAHKIKLEVWSQPTTKFEFMHEAEASVDFLQITDEMEVFLDQSE